jgi:hypothetical protein
MKLHLYEFRERERKLRCTCGWERTMKSKAPKLVSKKFSDHCAEMALKTN